MEKDNAGNVVESGNELTTVPEEAILEAQEVEERIASQSDMALILDALKQLTKEVAALKALQETKWEETEQFRRAGRFVIPFILTALSFRCILA